MSIVISLISVVIAILSLGFAIHSWLQANRPLVSAYISAVAGGNNAIALNIVVENSGNRPARDIKLVAKESDVLAALSTPSEIPIDAKRQRIGDRPRLRDKEALTNVVCPRF